MEATVDTTVNSNFHKASRDAKSELPQICAKAVLIILKSPMVENSN